MASPATMRRPTVLRELIEARGIRYSFIAEKLGIARSSFHRVLEGDRDLRARELVALTGMLGVEIAVFFDGERLLFADEIPPPDGVGTERTEEGVAAQGRD